MQLGLNLFECFQSSTQATFQNRSIFIEEENNKKQNHTENDSTGSTGMQIFIKYCLDFEIGNDDLKMLFNRANLYDPDKINKDENGLQNN